MISLNDTAQEVLANTTTNTPESTTNVDLDQWLNDEEFVRLKARLPKGVNIEEAMEYGFFEHQNRYWIRRKDDLFEPITNFTMKVLYLIMGANPKRIVEITNTRGATRTLDFAIEDLISLEKFKGRVEAQGNFLFEGRPNDLGKIKNKLFNNEKPSLEVGRLGQYKDKFFAFANGLYDGKRFLPIDEKGMVTHEGEHYYIPVFGSTQADDDEDLRNYRRFIHREGNITFSEWATRMVSVYGDNGKVGIAFALFALYSDIVFEKTKGAPMLFLFGQRSSGKGTMANSLLCLFGHPQDQIMLGGASTVVGFMRKLGQFSNGLVWLDEYKNDIGERKIESLKNIWDRIGYERGVKDNSNRTQSTSVTSCAIVSGQEIPNAEPALASREMILEFREREYTAQEIANFDALRRIEESGITSATLEALSHRPLVKAEFMKKFSELAGLFRAGFIGEEILERQINNYATIVAMFSILEEPLKLPFTAANLIKVCERLLVQQRNMMRQSNEVQQFFEMLQYLVAGKMVEEGKDIQLQKGLVKIRMASIYPLYREHSKRQQMRCLDKGTLLNYLQSSAAYNESESKKSGHRFSGLLNPTTASVYLHSEILKMYGVNFSDLLQEPENQEDEQKTQPF
jgi:hypothetical protein